MKNVQHIMVQKIIKMRVDMYYGDFLKKVDTRNMDIWGRAAPNKILRKNPAKQILEQVH